MSETSMPVFEDARSAALAQPLPGASPLGVDVRNLPLFDELETDVRLMETEGPAAVPWPQVARRGLDLLSTQGRDLLVAAWVTCALTQTEQWRGFAVGLDAISAMVKQWWEDIPPKRERARVGILEWVVTRLTPVVSSLPVGEDDVAAVLHASELLEDLNTLLPQKLVKERIAFGDLVRAVRPKAEEAKALLARAAQAAAEREEAEAASAAAAQAAAADTQAAPPAAPEPAAEAQAPETSAAVPQSASAAPAVSAPPPAAAVAAGATGPELDRAIGSLADSMRQHARALRETNLADPRSYRLTRAAAWLNIMLPPQATNNATQLMAPSAERMESVAAMGRSGEHEALVQSLEGMVGSSPFWLDANRMTFEALSALGGKFALAAEAVVETTGAFARRLPMLMDLTFSNGTLFASPATRAWLEQHGGDAGGGSADAQSGDLVELAGEIQDLVGAAKKAEALDRLGAARESVRGERALFDLHLLQVQTCLDLDIPLVALPLMQHLDDEVERRALEAWEPGLALRAARLALRAYRHPAAEKTLGAQRLQNALETAQRRLARLDLRTAVRLVHA